MEYQDEKPVTEYKATLRGTFDVDSSFGELMNTGRVVIWLVAASTGKFEVTTTKEGDDATRKNIQMVEDALPLTGALRDQAIIYMSHDGVASAVDFGTPTESEIELDRMMQYLTKSWASDTPTRPSAEDLVNVVIDLLESYRAGEKPKSALERAHESQEVQPGEAEAARPDGDVHPERMGEGPDAPEGEVDEPGEEPGAPVEVIETYEPGTDEPGKAVDVAKLRRELKNLIGDDDDEPATPSPTMGVGKTADAYVAKDEDYPDDVTVFGDDHEVIGSVYGPGYSGKNRDLIESVPM